jgi:hypothetical protein
LADLGGRCMLDVGFWVIGAREPMGPGTARTDALKLVMRVPRMMVGRFSVHARHEKLIDLVGTGTFFCIPWPLWLSNVICGWLCVYERLLNSWWLAAGHRTHVVGHASGYEGRLPRPTFHRHRPRDDKGRPPVARASSWDFFLQASAPRAECAACRVRGRWCN